MKTNRPIKILFLMTLMLTGACSPESGLISSDTVESTASPPPVAEETALQSAAEPALQILPGVTSNQVDVPAESPEDAESTAIDNQPLPFEEELNKRKERLPVAEDDTDETREPVGNVFKLPL